MRILTDFVDEANDISRFIFNVANESFELLFKLATNSRTSHDRRKVNGKDAFILERLLRQFLRRSVRRRIENTHLRNLFGDDSTGESFQNGRLSYSRWTDQLGECESKCDESNQDRC